MSTQNTNATAAPAVGSIFSDPNAQSGNQAAGLPAEQAAAQGAGVPAPAPALAPVDPYANLSPAVGPAAVTHGAAPAAPAGTPREQPADGQPADGQPAATPATAEQPLPEQALPENWTPERAFAAANHWHTKYNEDIAAAREEAARARAFAPVMAAINNNPDLYRAVAEKIAGGGGSAGSAPAMTPAAPQPSPATTAAPTPPTHPQRPRDPMTATPEDWEAYNKAEDAYREADRKYQREAIAYEAQRLVAPLQQQLSQYQEQQAAQARQEQQISQVADTLFVTHGLPKHEGAELTRMVLAGQIAAPNDALAIQYYKLYKASASANLAQEALPNGAPNGAPNGSPNGTQQASGIPQATLAQRLPSQAAAQAGAGASSQSASIFVEQSPGITLYAD